MSRFSSRNNVSLFVFDKPSLFLISTPFANPYFSFHSRSSPFSRLLLWSQWTMMSEHWNRHLGKVSGDCGSLVFTSGRPWSGWQSKCARNLLGRPTLIESPQWRGDRRFISWRSSLANEIYGQCVSYKSTDRRTLPAVILLELGMIGQWSLSTRVSLVVYCRLFTPHSTISCQRNTAGKYGCYKFATVPTILFIKIKIINKIK